MISFAIFRKCKLERAAHWCSSEHEGNKGYGFESWFSRNHCDPKQIYMPIQKKEHNTDSWMSSA